MDFRFYHLDSNPFVTNAADHLFWNATHQSVWEGLIERIEARHGIIGVLGQAGLGKSRLLQTYRSSVDPKYVHVLEGIEATQSQGDLLTSLARAFGLTGSGTDPEAQLSAIYQHCHTAHACGRRMVLLIDDAHTLSITALGNLHELFERLHREDEPLLQMVLCGRPTLQRHCQYPEFYLFEQAMATSLRLFPLAAEDRAAYIQHYLQSACTQHTRIFTKRALKLIVDHTHGIPKLMNITCADILVAGLLAGEKPISVATVQSVLGDDAIRLSPIVRWGLVSVAGLLLAAGLWSLFPEASPTDASQAVPLSETPSPTLMAQAVTAAAQLITALRPSQASVPEPDTLRRPPVATSPEAEHTIEEFRERQPPRRIASPPMSPEPVGTPVDTKVAGTTVAGPDQPSTLIRRPEAIALVAPAAFVPPEPEPNSPQPSDKAEVLARLDNDRHGDDGVRKPQPSPTRTPLIASVEARLLCAMPRAGGQLGSDIVLFGDTRHSVHRLVDDGSQNMSPVLSPDGAHLAYTSYRGGAPNIYLRNLASGQEIQLTSGTWLTLPGAWSPNGRYLSLSQSVSGNHDIFIYDMMQQRLRRLTQHKGIDVSPSFAPDSQRLVFSSDRTGSPQLYITDIAGTSPLRLTRTGTYNTSPSWSPRDDAIAFVGRDKHMALDLYLIKSDGTQRQRLTQGQRFHTPPAWLPDGHTFMGMSLRNAVWERHLVQVHPDRAAPILPQPESLCLAPQWVAYRAP